MFSFSIYILRKYIPSRASSPAPSEKTCRRTEQAASCLEKSEDLVLSARNKISELNSLRVPKPRFWLSAPHLRASASAGKFAAFIKGVPLQHAAKRAEPSQSEDFVSSARNKISEPNLSKKAKSHFCLFPPSCRKAHGWGESGAHSPRRAPKSAPLRGKPLGFPLPIGRFCFVSSKQNLRVISL